MILSYARSESRRRRARGLATVLAALTLAGCSMNSNSGEFEGIGFREARYQEVSAFRGFRECREEALQLDSQARASGVPARYLSSATLMESCEADLGPEATGISNEERMRAYGLTIQNYIKGGDPAAATRNLDRFERAFPRQDLYYADGSSFRETMEVLLGQRDSMEFGRFATLNVSTTLKDEMRRIEYWKHN